MGQGRAEWRVELGAMVKLAVPVVLSELGWMVMGVVDTIMVGRLGPAAIGAVALGNAVCYTPSMFGIGLLLGLDTLVAQAYGRKDHDECHRWLAQGVYLASISAVPIMAGIALVSFFFARFGIAAEVAAPASRYMSVLLWGTLPLLIYAASRRYLQGVGQVRVITVTYVAANLVNWFLNWVLIYGKLGMPALGVNGSALSTVFARVTMALALIGFAWRYERKRGHPLFRHWAGPQIARLKQMLKLGTPAAGQILLEVGAWNLATFSAGYLTPVALATHQIVLNYASVTYMVPLGISAAAAVSVGHAVGAGDRGARATSRMAGAGTGDELYAAGGDGVADLAAAADRVVYQRCASVGGGSEAAGDCRGVRGVRRNPDGVAQARCAGWARHARRCWRTWWAIGCWDCRWDFFCASDCSGGFTDCGSG